MLDMTSPRADLAAYTSMQSEEAPGVRQAIIRLDHPGKRAVKQKKTIVICMLQHALSIRSSYLMSQSKQFRRAAVGGFVGCRSLAFIPIAGMIRPQSIRAT
ncbi:MAG: hypothetical protein B7X53_06125 [Hyphomonas sp. 34-62-18]|nr:MAG: hypothetical protein B7X53_06125 [Hyphomonas sp. 34-62-18]